MTYVSLQQLEEILPANELSRLAIEYQVDRCNQVRLPGSVVLVCLLNSLFQQESVTQRILEETYHKITGETADHSSFGKRLEKIPVPYFEDIFTQLYGRIKPQMTVGDTKSLRIKFLDSTIVNLSAKLIQFGHLYQKTGQTRTGSARRSIKSVFALSNEGLPRFLRLAISKSENSDNPAFGHALRDHTQPGDLWVFDSGCHDRMKMKSLHQANAFFLTPHSTQTLNVETILWQRDASLKPVVDLPEPGKDENGQQQADYHLVRVERAFFGNTQDKQKWQTLPLIVVHGCRWDKRKKTWQPLVVMTNLPLSADGVHAGPYTFLEVASLYRRRWEIETFFKFLKQHLNYRHILSRNENGLRVMIVTSMIAALLLIWFKSVSKIDRGWRSVKFWLAEDIRQWTQQALEEAFERHRLMRKATA